MTADAPLPEPEFRMVSILAKLNNSFEAILVVCNFGEHQ